MQLLEQREPVGEGPVAHDDVKPNSDSEYLKDNQYSNVPLEQRADGARGRPRPQDNRTSDAPRSETRGGRGGERVGSEMEVVVGGEGVGREPRM